MNTTDLRTRLSAFVLSILMSTAVLGATVLSMQPAQDPNMQVIALEPVTVTATAIN
ncbi:MAG: hypothetical protein ACM3PU_09685 [Gemmatimonadota bacterium]